MESVSVRYIVHDVDEAIGFYTRHLGFEVELHPAPGFALLTRERLRLLLNAPGAGGAGRAAGPDEQPTPGGWNRFQLPSRDVDAEVARFQRDGVRIVAGPVEGKGGRQVLVADPSGNLVELLEPADPARRG